MHEFIIQAHILYACSKKLFFRLIPDCDVNFIDGHTQMFFNLREVAEQQKKADRRKIAALVIGKCTEEHINRFVSWLSEYFSVGMQEELFDLVIGENGKILLGNKLRVEINNIRKR